MASNPTQLLAMLSQNSGLAGQFFMGGQEQARKQQQDDQNTAINAVKLQQVQQQAASDAGFQTDWADYLKSPTTDKLAQIAVKYPSHAEAMQQFWKIKDPEVRQSHITAIAQPLAALQNGKVDLALTSLQQMRDATAKAGHPTDDLDNEIAALQSGDKDSINAVKATMMMHLAAADTDGKFAESMARAQKAFAGGDPYTLGAGDVRYDGNNNVVARGAPKQMEPFHYTEKDASGQEHEYIYDPSADASGASGSASGGSPGGGAGQPLTTRLNNPGAIRFDPKNQWQGQVRNNGGFVEFDTPENGARAHRILIANQIKAGYDTPLAWANHYAPASDGNDPQAYAKTVAQGLGIGINDKIPLGAVGRVAALSARVEGGGTPSPASLAGRTGGSRQIDPIPVNNTASNDLGDPSLTGDAYLNSLPAAMRAKVVAVAEGRAAAPRPGTRFGESLLTAVTQYDPTFDAANATSRVKTRVDFTSGRSAQAVGALNTAMGHLFHLDDQIADLKNVGVFGGMINPARRWAQNNVAGSAAYKTFDQTKQAAASEMRKVFAGSTGGNLTELKEWQDSFDSASSPEQLHAAVQNGIQLLGSRLNSLQDQYAKGMNRSDQVPQFLRPSIARTAKLKFGVDLDSASAPAGSASRPASSVAPASAPTPVRVQTAADAARLRPGTRYVRPDGVVMVR